MSLFLTHTINSKPALIKQYLKAMLLAMVTTIIVGGCDSKPKPNADTLVQLFEDKIVIDHSMVQTSTPERYQPSFNLEGSLVPVERVDIKTSYPVLFASIKVEAGQEVEQGQPVLEIKSKIAQSKLHYIVNEIGNEIDTEIGNEINDEFVEVYVNGVQIKNIPKSDTASIQAHTKAETRSEKSLPPNGNAQFTHNASTAESSPIEKPVAVTLVFKSPIKGTVTAITDPNSKISVNTKDNIEGNSNNNSADGNDSNSVSATQSNLSSPIITVANTKKLQLIGKLPLSTESQLAVGNPVTFTVHKLQKEFTGQISHIIPEPKSNTLFVQAPLVAGENSKEQLAPGMLASMHIDYGQIELGVRLPRSAIHEAQLEQLTKKQPRPKSPITVYVWVIEQDQTLAYTPVGVMEYFADSDKFLVSGISNESLVCLADLPKNSIGKKVFIN
ncbi:hypothetical protein [Psychrobacter sp.]|uniref:hypothetical protein n=1 Tax=Psychrobacter sp. TaxID=56811 RepID=UPI0025F10E3D|nr:hypothetical protein [Psychrobacter sp.]